MRNRYRIAAAKGCQGIDPDNMNGWSVDTGFPISYENQLVYNRYVSAEARVLGMLAGLKNDNEQASDLIDAVDFAVLEVCIKNFAIRLIENCEPLIYVVS